MERWNDILSRLTSQSNDSVLLPLMKEAFRDAADFETIAIGAFEGEALHLCYLTTITGSERLSFTFDPEREHQEFAPLEQFTGRKITETDKLEECEQALLDGKTIVCTLRSSLALILETGDTQTRGVQLPQTENVIRGPMYAFNESYNTNVAILRQRIRTSRLKIRESTVGTISRTKVGLVYLEGSVDLAMVDHIQDQIEQIQIDGIQDTGELQELLTNRSGWNPFPMTLSTERPDRACASLLEGRVLILLDGTPFSLIAPTVFFDFWHAAEDYYMPPIIATFLRLLRFLAMMMNVFLPAAYVALTSVNVDVNRLEISLAAAASREGVPYPVMIETLLMLIMLDLIIEAGTRLPKSIGSTVTMVGGIVLGQAIVQANVVSNLLVIIVAATSITNFIVVDYQMGLVQRLLKYGVLLTSGIIGVLGIVISFAVLVVYLSRLESFGVSYMKPFGPLVPNRLKNTLFRPPIRWFSRRMRS